jgi:hypothetical protein
LYKIQICCKIKWLILYIILNDKILDKPEVYGFRITFIIKFSRCGLSLKFKENVQG